MTFNPHLEVRLLPLVITVWSDVAPSVLLHALANRLAIINRKEPIADAVKRLRQIID